MVVKRADVPAILAALASAVGRDIVYWEQPVSHYGRVAQA